MRSILAMTLAVAAAMAGHAMATLGVDVSQATMPDAFQCMKNSGRDFAIIRCWQSNGVPDPNCPHTIYNAWDGGMAHVDIYVFPCFSCGNPGGQIADTLSNLAKYNIHHSDSGGQATFGTLWLDIEGPQYWGSVDENKAFIQAMISAAQSSGVPVGVYSSESQWSPICGGADIASSLPLWYAHYDDSPSFGDFAPFGGWGHPAMKQYQGTTSMCGAGVDENYYP